MEIFLIHRSRDGGRTWELDAGNAFARNHSTAARKVENFNSAFADWARRHPDQQTCIFKVVRYLPEAED